MNIIGDSVKCQNFQISGLVYHKDELMKNRLLTEIRKIVYETNFIPKLYVIFT